MKPQFAGVPVAPRVQHSTFNVRPSVACMQCHTAMQISPKFCFENVQGRSKAGLSINESLEKFADGSLSYLISNRCHVFDATKVSSLASKLHARVTYTAHELVPCSQEKGERERTLAADLTPDGQDDGPHSSISVVQRMRPLLPHPNRLSARQPQHEFELPTSDPAPEEAAYTHPDSKYPC